jgi:hypothetical protein
MPKYLIRSIFFSLPVLFVLNKFYKTTKNKHFDVYQTEEVILNENKSQEIKETKIEIIQKNDSKDDLKDEINLFDKIEIKNHPVEYYVVKNSDQIFKNIFDDNMKLKKRFTFQ